MNTPLLFRLLKPILGSGDDAEGRIFTAPSEGPPLSPRHWADFAPWSAPAPETQAPILLTQAHVSGEMPGGATLPAPGPSLSMPADPHSSAELLLATPWIPPPLPAEERITVEGLGLSALRVTGTSRDDRLFGGPGDDRFDGLAGDDLFFCSPGRDLFHGGAGHDTIRYDRLRAEVSLDSRFQRISLEDGEDQYDGIEVIDLRDGDWVLTADVPAALVQRIWLAATGHAPTAAEMVRETAALQAGGTAEALAGRLAVGADAAAQSRIQAALNAPREGRLDQPVWLPDAEALRLTRMAELALGGAPPRDAFLHWLDELEAGVSPDAVAAGLLATLEGQAHAPGVEAHELVMAASAWML